MASQADIDGWRGSRKILKGKLTSISDRLVKMATEKMTTGWLLECGSLDQDAIKYQQKIEFYSGEIKKAVAGKKSTEEKEEMERIATESKLNNIAAKCHVLRQRDEEQKKNEERNNV